MLCFIVLAACSVNKQVCSNGFEYRHTPPLTEEKYNKCFSVENGYADTIYADSLFTYTKKKNFFKKKVLNDSMFIWSCGRNTIEYTIDTFPCKESVAPIFDWETTEFIALLKPCGSFCWTNIIYPLEKKKEPIVLSYSAIDFENMNVVSIDDKSFLILNLRTSKEIKIPIEGIECINSFPLFALSDIKLVKDKLFYTLKCKDGSMLKKEIDIANLEMVR